MVRLLQILLALLAVRIVWRIVRSFTNRSRQQVSRDSRKAELRGQVVGCERCDLHVPEERTVRRDGRTYCSAACAEGGSP